MKDTNKHSFEEEFKKVFEEAEATPSPVLWAEIDAHLANQEAARYKRRLFYYKMSAAAAVILLMSFIGLWSLNNDLSGNEGNIAGTGQIKSGNSSPASESSSQIAGTDTEQEGIAENPAIASTSIEDNTTETGGQDGQGKQLQQELPSTNSQETVAFQSPNTTAPTQPANSPSQLPEVTSGQPGNTSGAPAIIYSQPTLAENTQAPSLEKSSSKPTQDIVAQNKNIPSGKKVASEGFELADNTTGKKQTSGKNSTSTSRSGYTPELPANHIVKNAVTPNSKTGVISSNQPDNSGVSNPDRALYTIDPVRRTIAVANTIFGLQAPAVQTKTTPYPFWLEEEAEKEQKQKKTSGSRWSVALAFTPSQFDPNMRVNSAPVATANAKQAFSSYNAATPLSTGQTANTASPVSKDLQDAENFGLSYNVGMNLQYALTEKLSLQSGLQYMHNNSRIVTDNYLEDFSNKERYPVFLNVLGANNTSTAFVADNAAVHNPNSLTGVPKADMEPLMDLQNTYPGVTQVMVQNLYQYISVPLRLQYKLIDKKLSTSVGAGIAADVFLKNTIGNTDANVPEVEFNRQNNNVYKSIGISGLLSARVNYQFGGRYSVYVEPSYRTALSSFTRSDEIKSLPNSFGVGTGLQYRF